MHILQPSEGGVSECKVYPIRGTISVERTGDGARYVRIYVHADDAKPLYNCHGKKVAGLIVVLEQ
jgi:hypothetical protein